ncbi:MAG: HupE/UreJ family protein [Myxococcota bacterium]|nr:HupE/UreJ family protein [Myxococcota bacterium]
MRAAAAAALGLALGLAAPSAGAHEARPLYAELRESAPGALTLRWRTPGSVPDFNLPDLSLEAPCIEAAAPLRARGTGGRRYRCPPEPAGVRLLIRYPAFKPSVTTLVRFERASGEVQTAVLAPGAGAWALPAATTTGGVARQYLGLGVAHILGGFDHLLFLACLVFVARTPRRILVTVTGFTLAHSATLALAALGWVRLPVAPVEAAIALSVVFLASEIARGPRATLTWRRPIAVSSAFGLLHGLGFASVLGEIGLPPTELVAALLAFNLGVELGQLAFLAALLAAWWLVRLGLGAARALRGDALLERLRVPVGYGVGWVASYWLILRVADF